MRMYTNDPRSWPWNCLQSPFLWTAHLPQLCNNFVMEIDACEISKWTCQVGIPWAPCSCSQCLCDIFWHHFDVSQASQTEHAHTWALDFPTQIFFPVFPIPVNDTAILIARDLEMSLVPPLYPLRRIDQCICGLFCSFQHLLSRP